jgi:CheY-like chemotaxis protein
MSESEEPPREVLAAWVQFLRGDITEAVNALNNRLNVIGAHASMEEQNLTDEQKHLLEQIRLEVGKAAKITAGLLRKVTAMAPDTAPAVIHEYDGSSLETANILLVEDDDANRAVIRKLFERLGHTVTAVTNGLEAYEVLRAGAVDCVISDVRLPFAGGRTLFEQVEQNLPHLASRFVFVTGDYTNPESRAFLDQTGQPVVGKPYELDTLLGAVAAILHKLPR